jgi:AcrR family transcriptional regulator
LTALATRTQRRVGRNRAAILAAAEALFGARGVDSVSIDEVAAAADLAKGTVYNHFADKDSLAREIAAIARADGETRVRAANDGVADPVRRTVRGMLVFARFALERPERARAMLRMTPQATDPDAPVNAGLRADVAGAMAAGAFSTTTEAGTAAMIGLATSLISRITDGAHDRGAALELAIGMGSIALRGLGVAPAEAQRIAAAEAHDIFGGET